MLIDLRAGDDLWELLEADDGQRQRFAKVGEELDYYFYATDYDPHRPRISSELRDLLIKDWSRKGRPDIAGIHELREQGRLPDPREANY